MIVTNRMLTSNPKKSNMVMVNVILVSTCYVDISVFGFFTGKSVVFMKNKVKYVPSDTL